MVDRYLCRSISKNCEPDILPNNNEIETQFTVRRPRRPTNSNNHTTHHILGRRPSAKLIISMLVQPDRLDRNPGHYEGRNDSFRLYRRTHHNRLSFCGSIDFEYSSFRRELAIVHGLKAALCPIDLLLASIIDPQYYLFNASY